MRIQKPIAILLAIVMAMLAILGAFLVKVGMTTPQVFKKLCFFVCALMIVIIAVFGHYGLGYDAMDFIYGQY